ncbi:MAG: ankyrin repeat domain-containing protein [Candidatus Babeliales bacterium]|jgi:hypothetical protein
MKNMTKCFFVTLALIAGSFHCGWAMQAPLSENEQRLIAAANSGDSETVARLLKIGVNVNALDPWLSDTALMKASTRGHTEIVRMLLAVDGINVDAQNIWPGNTALMQASYWGHIDIVRILLAAKADVNAKTLSRYTALMKASSKGHAAIVHMLIAVDGINVNAYNDLGNTALMEVASASMESDRSSLYLMRAIDLLKAGADITLTNYNGKTALDLARENGNIEIVQLFERYLEAIRDCVADEWRDGLPLGGQPNCPLEVIKEYVMPFLDPDQK